MASRVRELFRTALRNALDDYHPYWEKGQKGKEQPPHLLPKFTAISAETLRGWVAGKQDPKPGVFTKFLVDAEFPDDLYTVLLQCYRRLHDEPNEKKSEVVNTDEDEGIQISQPRTAFLGRILNLKNSGMWGALLLVAAIGIGVGSLLYISQPFRMVRGIAHLNGWCSMLAESLISTGTMGSVLAVSDAAQVSDFINHPYYVYFDNQFIGADTLNLNGRDPQQHQWQFSITPTWITTHTNWIDPTRWRIDYRCDG